MVIKSIFKIIGAVVRTLFESAEDSRAVVGVPRRKLIPYCIRVRNPRDIQIDWSYGYPYTIHFTEGLRQYTLYRVSKITPVYNAARRGNDILSFRADLYIYRQFDKPLPQHIYGTIVKANWRRI